MISYIKKRWSAPNGYREVLTLPIPLILSTGSRSIQQFVDRMFLGWHSKEALAAAMPAGMLNFALICIFLGTVSYAGTFISQYMGANEKDKVGTVLWHSIFLALLGGVVLLFFAPFAKPIFALIGHDAAIQPLEESYFRILFF